MGRTLTRAEAEALHEAALTVENDGEFHRTLATYAQSPAKGRSAVFRLCDHRLFADSTSIAVARKSLVMRELVRLHVVEGAGANAASDTVTDEARGVEFLEVEEDDPLASTYFTKVRRKPKCLGLPKPFMSYPQGTRFRTALGHVAVKGIYKGALTHETELCPQQHCWLEPPARETHVAHVRYEMASTGRAYGEVQRFYDLVEVISEPSEATPSSNLDTAMNITTATPALASLTAKIPAVIRVDTQTLINGEPADNLTDAQLYEVIALQEAELARLDKIAAKPKKLKEEIERRRQGITALVDFIDSRDAK